MSAQEHTHTDVDAVVVGAGFAGLYMLHTLRNTMGLRVQGFEAGAGVGGTWHWNRYPGARCDTESYIYCYSFDEQLLAEWKWSEKYPQQAEILRYLNHVADRFDLRRSFAFETRVESAAYDESGNVWVVTTDDGKQIRSRFLVTGLGLLSAGFVPEFPGLQSFQGEWAHTSRWPEDLSLEDKRVGIIGTSSTGVQMTPVVAETAAELVVFQRTAQYTIPAKHGPLDPQTQAEIDTDYAALLQRTKWSAGGFPYQHNGLSALDVTAEERRKTLEELWEEGGFKFLYGSYKDVLLDREANRIVSDFVREKIRARVGDPELADKLTPEDYPFGARRPVIDSGYFETFRRPNVDLVDVKSDPIVEVTPTGIRTEKTHYELDVIVLATGFDAVTGSLLRMNIQGRDGQTLSDKWKDGPVTYLGLAVSGFPNLFTITGPGSTFGNAPVSIEHHVEWIAGCIQWMMRNEVDTLEAKPEAEREWLAHVDEAGRRTLIPGTDSWFTGANIPGKPRAFFFYPGSFKHYRGRCESVAEADYAGFEAH